MILNSLLSGEGIDYETDTFTATDLQTYYTMTFKKPHNTAPDIVLDYRTTSFTNGAGYPYHFYLNWSKITGNNVYMVDYAPAGRGSTISLSDTNSGYKEDFTFVAEYQSSDKCISYDGTQYVYFRVPYTLKCNHTNRVVATNTEYTSKYYAPNTTYTRYAIWLTD